MIQKDKMTYAEYHEEVGHYDRRSEKIQRDEIERCIATLYKEADWWTLNDLRILIGKLVGIDMDGPGRQGVRQHPVQPPSREP